MQIVVQTKDEKFAKYLNPNLVCVCVCWTCNLAAAAIKTGFGVDLTCFSSLAHVEASLPSSSLSSSSSHSILCNIQISGLEK